MRLQIGTILGQYLIDWNSETNYQICMRLHRKKNQALKKDCLLEKQEEAFFT